MLYVNLSNNRRLYVNAKKIGKILLVVGWITAYLYLSNQEYLTFIKKIK